MAYEMTADGVNGNEGVGEHETSSVNRHQVFSTNGENRDCNTLG